MIATCSKTFFSHKVIKLESKRFPKNFQPVGVSKHGIFNARATLSTAELVGMDRATPVIPSLQPGTHFVLAVITARLSLGFTKHPVHKIIFLSPSPSHAAPKL